MKLLMCLILLIPLNLLANESVKVAVSPIEPFAYQDANGKWTGISIEMVEDVANSLNRDTIYTKISVQDNIHGVSTGNFDIGVGAISITHNRETLIDFSTPYFTSGLGIATKLKTISWTDWAINIGKTIFMFICFVFFGGLLIRYAENDLLNPDLDTIGEGVWWSIVTISTTGYGDMVPKSLIGRLFASVWMVMGMVVVPVLVSNMSVSMTLERFDTTITNIHKLDAYKIGVIKGTSTETFFNDNNIPFVYVNDITHMMDSIDIGRIDGGAYDLPMLQFHARKYPNITILPQTLNQEFYGLVLSSDSELKEAVNLSILTLLPTYKWKGIKAKYLGT